MKKAAFFIDGFNLYHAIADRRLNWAKWMNFRALSQYYSNQNDFITAIHFYTALPVWDTGKASRLKILIQAEQSVGVRVIYGSFRKVCKTCRVCHEKYWTYEEKQTDVNIAVNLLKMAMDDNYDRAYILSGDSDLVPSIQMVKQSFPEKEFGVIIPAHRKAESMKKACDFHIRMKENHYRLFRFPGKLDVHGHVIKCPASWQ